MNGAAVPRFARGFRFRHDAARSQWVVLGPERAFVPDDIAQQVLRRIDGVASIAAICADLADAFDAPLELIADDVDVMLTALVDKGVLVLD